MYLQCYNIPQAEDLPLSIVNLWAKKFNLINLLTNVFVFENAYFSMRLRVSFILKRLRTLMKTETFENGFKKSLLKTHRFENAF